MHVQLHNLALSDLRNRIANQNPHRRGVNNKAAFGDDVPAFFIVPSRRSDHGFARAQRFHNAALIHRGNVASDDFECNVSIAARGQENALHPHGPTFQQLVYRLIEHESRRRVQHRHLARRRFSVVCAHANGSRSGALGRHKTVRHQSNLRIARTPTDRANALRKLRLKLQRFADAQLRAALIQLHRRRRGYNLHIDFPRHAVFRQNRNLRFSGLNALYAHAGYRRNLGVSGCKMKLRILALRARAVKHVAIQRHDLSQANAKHAVRHSIALDFQLFEPGRYENLRFRRKNRARSVVDDLRGHEGCTLALCGQPARIAHARNRLVLNLIADSIVSACGEHRNRRLYGRALGHRIAFLRKHKPRRRFRHAQLAGSLFLSIIGSRHDRHRSGFCRAQQNLRRVPVHNFRLFDCRDVRIACFPRDRANRVRKRRQQFHRLARGNR